MEKLSPVRKHVPPPTLAHLRDVNGITAARIFCAAMDCSRMRVVAFAALGLPDDTSFPEIARLRSWRCERCGSRVVTVMPNWITS